MKNKSLALFIEESIWGEGNVPAYISRELVQVAKRIVIEDDIIHLGHVECSSDSCVL